MEREVGNQSKCDTVEGRGQGNKRGARQDTETQDTETEHQEANRHTKQSQKAQINQTKRNTKQPTTKDTSLTTHCDVL